MVMVRESEGVCWGGGGGVNPFAAMWMSCDVIAKALSIYF